MFHLKNKKNLKIYFDVVSKSILLFISYFVVVYFEILFFEVKYGNIKKKIFVFFDPS